MKKKSVSCSSLLVLFHQTESEDSFMDSTYTFYIYCISLCEKLSFSIIYYVNDKALADQAVQST